MPTTYLVKEVSTITGSSPATVRSWCSTFAEFFSPTATPPEGQQRVFTEKDLAIFQRIVELRSTEKLGNDAMIDRLRNEGTAHLQPFVDVAIDNSIPPQPPAPMPQPTPAAQESPQAPQTAIELYTGIIGHTTALQASLDSLRQRVDAQEKDRTGRVTLLALGFVAGLLVAAILIGGAWLMK